jgi:tetratricopeptide (TPR) repeat protein
MNWRAYKHLGSLYARERSLTLEPEERLGIAKLEREVLEEGYLHNTMDAGLVLSLGRVTLFLGEKDRGLKLLKQTTVLRPYNDNVWWRYGVELRKFGRYEDALGIFRTAEAIHGTPSIRKNIQWLEKQLSHVEGKDQPDSAAAEKATNQALPKNISRDEIKKMLDLL